jgi:DNA-binding transcriptional LysR family regulator
MKSSYSAHVWRGLKRIQIELRNREASAQVLCAIFCLVMEISQLRALLAVKESASLTLAGKRLGLSTSAIFCQFRQLEQEIGKKLYHQIGKKLRLTDAGELLLRDAIRIVEMHDSAVSSVKEATGLQRRLVRIGCGPHSSVKIVPHLLRALLAAHPNTDVRLITSDDSALLHDLRIGILDAVFLSLPVGDAELTEEALWSYEMVLVMPPGFSKGKTSSSQLKKSNLPFILLRRLVVTDLAFQQFCHDFDFEPDVVVENSQPDSIKQMVRLGLGMSVLPEWSVVDEQRKRVLAISRLKSRFLHNYGVLSRRSGYRPQALDDLLTVSRKWREWWPLAGHVHDPI